MHGDNEILVIGTETGIMICKDLCKNHKFHSSASPITAICVNHEYLAIAERSGEVSLWNLINQTRLATTKQKESLGFSSLIFYNNTFLIGSGFNGKIYIYTYKTNLIIVPAVGLRKSKESRRMSIKLFKIIQAHSSDIFTMIKINRHFLATGSTDHSIKIWDITNFKCVKTLKGHSMDILCLACDDDFLWSGSMDKSISSKFIFYDD
jgi:WD40 repeat protein